MSDLVVEICHARRYYERARVRKPARTQLAELRALLGTVGEKDLDILLEAPTTAPETVIDLLNAFHEEGEIGAVRRIEAWLTERHVPYSWIRCQDCPRALLDSDAELIAARQRVVTVAREGFGSGE
jgi:hypothetical protein